MSKNYEISVIVPVYNAEKYLAEALESVINQTLGFDKIQMILVNDGSSDGSGGICMHYSEKYPENILYVNKENEGVSKTRNTGLKYAKGRYVSFLDSDDKWDLNAFKLGVDALDEHEDVSFAAYRLKYFEKIEDYHMLDYKFQAGNRVVDILEAPQDIAIHGAPVLYRRTALPDKAFDEALKISEDTKLLYDLAMNCGKYYLISDATYYYRKHWDEGSAIQVSKTAKSWYNDTLERAHIYLIKKSIEQYGYVIKYVQYFVMYELQWRTRKDFRTVLSEAEQAQYIKNIQYIMENVDIAVIAAQRNMSWPAKFLALKIKYGDAINKQLTITDNEILLEQKPFCEVDKLANYINVLRMENGKLLMIGTFQFLQDCKLYIKLDDKLVQLETYEREIVNTFGPYQLSRIGYTEMIDIASLKSIELFFEYEGNKYRLKNSSEANSRLSNKKGHCYIDEQQLLRWKDGRKRLEILHTDSANGFNKAESDMLKSMKKAIGCKAVLIRKLAKLYGQMKKGELWLLADKSYRAGDNAEAFFKYLIENKSNTGRKYCFVLDKASEDYERMKRLGKVVSPDSLEYKLMLLNADFLLVSRMDAEISNPFGDNLGWYIDMMRYKLINLSHGIVLQDLSHWENRVKNDISFNLVSSPLELAAMMTHKYHLEESQFLKTGMPRLDGLIRDGTAEKTIALIPGWKSSPSVRKGEKQELAAYHPGFKKTEYFKFYKQLLSDEALINKLKDSNTKLKVFLPQVLEAQYQDFVPLACEQIEIVGKYRLNEIAALATAVITDDASIACDYAYVKKPIVYIGMNLGNVYDTRYYDKEYFDYEKYGFGDCCMSYEQLLQSIGRLVDNKFKIEEKYVERMKAFFYNVDGKNCERFYNAITQGK